MIISISGTAPIWKSSLQKVSLSTRQLNRQLEIVNEWRNEDVPVTFLPGSPIHGQVERAPTLSIRMKAYICTQTKLEK
jgi:hypothetical protein